jgi:S-(hydroxymethyl)glutathione dehydrogenase / alcohol dehydrogenase
MRAGVFEKVGSPLLIDDIEIDDPLPGEVIVEVRASGLCHSDLTIMRHGLDVPLPAVLGHEVAGVVGALGDDVEEFRVGDHVVAHLLSYCGVCSRCVVGNVAECLHPETTRRQSGGRPRLRRGSESLFQMNDLGGFAERILVHHNNLVRVTADIPFDKAALLGCGVITGAGAAIRTADVRVGDTVAVIGCGGIGLSAIQGAALAGARRVIAIDVQPAKLELARRFGATDVVNSADADIVAAVRAITETDGVDRSIEAVGLKTTAQDAIRVLGQGGAAFLIGLQRPGTLIEVDPWEDFVFGHRSVKGVYMGNANPRVDIPLYADLYLQGRFNLDDMVSQTIPLESVNDGYEALASGEVARSVVTFA